MRITWRDGVSALLVGAGGLIFLAVSDGWGWPLLGGYRAGAAALLVVSALAASVLVVPVTFASAGDTLRILDVGLVSPVEPLTFTLEIEDDSDCDQGTFEVLTVLANDVVVTPISVTESATDPNVATIVLPSNTTPGTLEASAVCDNGEFPMSAEGSTEWGALAVTKTVVGPVPAGTTFSVNASCVSTLVGPPIPTDLPANFAPDLAYGAAGGVKYVYTDHQVECTITEPVNGGATSTVITPAVVDMSAPAAYTATVTNTFVAAVQPTFTG